MTHATRTIFIAILAAATLSLAACGGGGGSSPTQSAPVSGGSGGGSGGGGGNNQAPPPAVTAASMYPTSGYQVSGSVPAYTATGPNLEFLTAVSAIRQAAGLGVFNESAALDASAAAHLAWMLENTSYGPTTSEVSGTPGFTGTTAQARAIATGYSASGVVGEGYSGADTTTQGGGTAAGCVAGLAADPQGIAMILNGSRDIGVAVVIEGSGAAASALCIFDFGYVGAPQLPLSTAGAYPAGGVAVATGATADVLAGPCGAGYPIAISLDNFSNRCPTSSDPATSFGTVAVNSWKLTDSFGNGVPATAYGSPIWTGSVVADPGQANGSIDDIGSGRVLVISPTAKLVPNSSYSYTASVTVTCPSAAPMQYSVAGTFQTIGF